MNLMWDDRYSQPGFAYGTKPNAFLKSVVDVLPKGRILSLAEGEGRNAVFLAEQGYDVVAVDASPVGLIKAERLAREREVSIATVTADLSDFYLGLGAWDGIVSIFCHLPTPVRERVHSAVVAALRPGGTLVLEGYNQHQLRLGTGGPRDLSMLFSLPDLRKQFAGLELSIAREVEREVHEGPYRNGVGAVVQIVGHKPSGSTP